MVGLLLYLPQDARLNIKSFKTVQESIPWVSIAELACKVWKQWSPKRNVHVPQPHNTNTAIWRTSPWKATTRRSKLRYKDVIKRLLKACKIDHTTWVTACSDRSVWQNNYGQRSEGNQSQEVQRCEMLPWCAAWHHRRGRYHTMQQMWSTLSTSHWVCITCEASPPLSRTQLSTKKEKKIVWLKKE